MAPIVKAVRAYDDKEWEIFISEWQKGLTQYKEVKRLGGGGDLGRDVIGLCGPEGCEGIWDNYQCKHYAGLLGTPTACEDAGKIIFHAFMKRFRAPRRCIFVAPRGPNVDLRDMLLNSSKFRAEVIATWGARVASRVVQGEVHDLVGDLRDYVEAYDFTSFGYSTLDEILDDHRKTGYWASRFGGLLPPAPAGSPPPSIAATESVYVGKLVDAYAEVMGTALVGAGDPSLRPDLLDDLQRQRVRFYDAEAFNAHYRDQTEPGTVEDFAEQVFDAVEPSMAPGGTGLQRLSSALTAAGAASPASVLAPRAKTRVKQGVCHQLANSGRLTWKL